MNPLDSFDKERNIHISDVPNTVSSGEKPAENSSFSGKLVEQAYNHLPIGLLANVIIPLLLGFALWKFVDRAALLIWASLIYILTALRYVLLMRYRRATNRESDWYRWRTLFFVSASAAAIAWGLSGVVLFSDSSDFANICIIFAAGGMISGSTISLSSLKNTAQCYIILVATPLIIKLFTIPSGKYMAMGIMVIIYMLLTVVLSRRINAMIIDSLQLGRDFSIEADKRRKTVDQLEKAQAQLIKQEKLAAIGQLSGSVAHDLRNPLGVINNSVYFIKKILEKDTDPRIIRHIDIMENEIKRSCNIISDLTDFSQENKLLITSGNLNDLLRDILEVTHFREDIIVKTLLDQNLPEVQFDSLQLRRAFQNLINNAIQAMPEGGQLEIITYEHNEIAHIIIKDTGIGISKEDMKRIYEPLFSTKPHGVGLGLSIVKDLVEKHNGTIEVESTSGKGTIFTIKLPCKQKQTA